METTVVAQPLRPAELQANPGYRLRTLDRRIQMPFGSGNKSDSSAESGAIRWNPDCWQRQSPLPEKIARRKRSARESRRGVRVCPEKPGGRKRTRQPGILLHPRLRKPNL